MFKIIIDVIPAREPEDLIAVPSKSLAREPSGLACRAVTYRN